MRKILNPYHDCSGDEYNCFGCSPNNGIGLHLHFFEDGEELYAEWQPDANYMGYPGILHGGIQATLLDEIGGWVVYIKCETVGVTQDMTVKYLSPLRMDKGKVSLRAKLIEQTEKNAIILATIFDGSGKLCSEATLNYYVYPQPVAVKRFYYPGIEAFYESAEILGGNEL